VDAIRVHAERTVTLDLFGRSGNVTLLVSAETDVTRLHVARRRPPSPATPLPFQGLLRREVEGATLVRLEVLPGDRVVELELARAGNAVRLVGELTGRHGNLFLVGPDGNVVASAGRNLSQRRDLLPGKAWVAPAARPERSDAADRFAGTALRGSEPFPISAAIEQAYAGIEEERAAAEARRRLRDPVRAAMARALRALEKLAEEAARIPAAEEDRRRADLLKQNLHEIRRGARETVVTEWTETGSRHVAVPLDPARGPRENMERYYRRYRRIVESAARVASRTGEVRARLDELGNLFRAIEGARLEDLPRLEREARRLGAAPRPPAVPRSKRDEPLPPYRLFRSLADVPILVGRNAEANDVLTVTVARGNDLWLHARGLAGSHVVARLEKGKPPDGETLLDAAHLAAHFSDGRGEAQVEVVATRAKHVRKAKGAPPGSVTYTQEKTIFVRVEARRVERLLASEEGRPLKGLSHRS
jgi:predicted ribosome quality control (RQC) complex YloA/Tae2 family protein